MANEGLVRDPLVKMYVHPSGDCYWGGWIQNIAPESLGLEDGFPSLGLGLLAAATCLFPGSVCTSFFRNNNYTTPPQNSPIFPSRFQHFLERMTYGLTTFG